MTHKKSLLLLFLLFAHPINNFISFAIQLQPNSRSCLKEWFPQNESIAVNYDILVPSQSDDNNFDKLPPIAEQYQMLQHSFFSENRDLLGKIDNEKETWTYVTHQDEIITFCANNLSPSSIIVEYNITVNIYNNDHTRVADKTHLKMYEEDIVELEKLTLQLSSDNNIVRERTENRKIQIAVLGDLVSKLTGLGIIFIIFIKVCAIFYLRRKLYEKKIL
jgi:hypothetical protein